jgi:hypothetical protein
MNSRIRMCGSAACVLAFLVVGCTPCCVGVNKYYYGVSYAPGYVYAAPVYVTPAYGTYDISNPGHTGYSYNATHTGYPRYLYTTAVYNDD